MNELGRTERVTLAAVIAALSVVALAAGSPGPGWEALLAGAGSLGVGMVLRGAVPPWASVAAAGAAAVVLVPLTELTVRADVLALGFITGLTYAILAVGLVLIYKAARFVNFAHGNLGALAAVLLAKLVIDLGVPYWLALPIVVVLSAGLGALVELTVVRRLFTSSRLVLMVATIGVSQLLLGLTLVPGLRADQGAIVTQGFPVPFTTTWRVGGLILLPADILILFVVPALAVGLAAFLRLSPYGQAIRAASENPDAARLAGISVKRMSTLVWVIAAVLSAVTAVLLAPKSPVFALGSLGPSLLVRALGAALIARMVNLPVAFAAGIGLGVLEQVVFTSFSEGGITDLVVFLVVMVALLIRARELGRSTRDAGANVVFGGAVRELPRAVAALPAVRRLRTGGVVASVAAAVLLPFIPVLGFDTQAKAFLFALVCGYAIVGLSLCLLTGWGGQVSLGQFALAGVGAFAAARLAGNGVPLPLVILGAGAIGAVAAVLVGLPAVRIQGLFLAVSTLAFAVVGTGWVFQQKAFVVTPDGVLLDRPGLLSSERAVYWFALALVVISALAVRAFRRSGPGRLLIAARDNEAAARAAGVSVTGARLVGFALSGFLAAVAGVVIAYARQRYTATSFDPATGFTVLSMVIVGGLGSIPGAILGAVFVFGLPVLFTDSALVSLLVSGVGLLVFLLFLPSGLIGVVHGGRDALVSRLARRAAHLPPPASLVPPLGELVRVALGRTATRSPSVPTAPPTGAPAAAGRAGATAAERLPEPEPVA